MTHSIEDIFPNGHLGEGPQGQQDSRRVPVRIKVAGERGGGESMRNKYL